MTWWRRWGRRGRTSAATAQAREQLAQAQADLAAARADNDPVDQVAARLAELRHRNRFGPMITEALRGSR